MKTTICGFKDVWKGVVIGTSLLASGTALAVPTEFEFSADVPEFSDSFFDPLESFLVNNLGLSEIAGTVSWDTDDLDANGDAFLEDPAEASVQSNLDAFESDTIGMFVGIDDGALIDIGSWEFQIDDDFFFLALIELNTNNPQWFVSHGETGNQTTTTAQNWRLVSTQSVPEPGSSALLGFGLLIFGLVSRGWRSRGEPADGGVSV